MNLLQSIKGSTFSSTCHTERGFRELELLNWEERRLKGIMSLCIISWWWKTIRGKLFSVVPNVRRRGNEHKLKLKSHVYLWSFIQVYFCLFVCFYGDIHTLEHIVGASIFGDIRKNPGHGSEQPGLPSLDQNTCRCAFLS